MEEVRVKDLKVGDLFTLKPIDEPKDTQVYIRDAYDRSERKYYAYKWSDVCTGCMLKGDRIVYVGFTF